MAAGTEAAAAAPPRPSPFRRARLALGGIGAAILGAAPHVLHHAGPLAGAALFAGAGGTLLFGALGLLAAAPWLVRLRRRTGGWRAPALALALFAAMFAFSTLVIGPALAGDGGSEDATEQTTTPAGHDGHHP